MTATKTRTARGSGATVQAQLDAAKERAAASGTELHGTFVEAFKILKPGDAQDTRFQTVMHDAYITIALAAMVILRDFLNMRAITFRVETEEGADLLNAAMRGLRALAGWDDEDVRHGALVLDWLGKERFAYFVHFYDAASKMEAADRAQVKADKAVEKLRATIPQAAS